MVIRQYKAKGPVCEMLLPVVAMDDALGLMAYAISISVAQAMVSGAPMTVVNMALIPLGEIVGSLVIGTVIGFVLSLCMSFFHSRGNKLALTIAAIFLALGLCDLWGLSNLLCIMMIGAVMTNVCKTANVVIEQTDRFTPPLFLLFFVISGAQLNLGVLPTVGLVGVCYVLFRVVGKWLGAMLGSRMVHAHPNVQKYLGFTLIPQAGVAIGLAAMTLTKLPQYGRQIQAIILAGTLIYELTGPDEILEKTYERGVEDFTLACGTGTGSVAAALTLLGRVSGKNVRVRMDGGELTVDAEEKDGSIENLYLTGPAAMVCAGEILDEAILKLVKRQEEKT